jgi:predicted component of type VI protein secretion system
MLWNSAELETRLEEIQKTQAMLVDMIASIKRDFAFLLNCEKAEADRFDKIEKSLEELKAA